MLLARLIALVIGLTIWAVVGLALWLILLPRTLLLFCVGLPIKTYRGASPKMLIINFVDTISIYPQGFRLIYNNIIHDEEYLLFSSNEEKSLFSFIFEIVQALILIYIVYFVFFSGTGLVVGSKGVLMKAAALYESVSQSLRALIRP